jgi:hypothetical protein
MRLRMPRRVPRQSSLKAKGKDANDEKGKVEKVSSDMRFDKPSRKNLSLSSQGFAWLGLFVILTGKSEGQ